MGRFLAVTFVGLITLLTACGAGGKSNTSTLAKQATDPRTVPIATLPAVLPSPVPASTITVGGIAAQSNSGPTTYTVKSGDTLAAIAQKLGVTLSQLQSSNSDINPASLRIGQELKVPPQATATPTASAGPLRPATSTSVSGTSVARTSTPSRSTSATASPASATTSAGGGQTYTVQSGDTACKIANNLRVSLSDLATANGTTAAGLASLKVGQTLKIPSSSSASAGC